MCIEQIGGEVAAKHAKSADARGEDRLSALPDDVLVLILLRLYTADAARTSVLSHRWRRIWTLLPELRFDAAQNPHFLRSAISASEVPLHSLLVGTLDASPQSLAAWLPAAATRVSGKLVLINLDQRSTTAGEEAEASQIELPCFEKANAIGLELGFLGLSVPPAGVFARLIDLYLHGVQFHSPGELEDFVSSPRCPCLQKLSIRNVRGLDSITIDSGTLLLLRLDHLHGVRKVTVVAPVLKDLSLVDCFLTDRNQPVVNISAPQLKFLNWVDAYDPSSICLGSIERLQIFSTFFFVYGLDGTAHNSAFLMLLPQFKAIECLSLLLAYLPEVDKLQYLMKNMTNRPDITSLALTVMAKGHAFGASSFHVLRICSGIRSLHLSFHHDLEEQTACSSDCICDQPTNWKTEEFSLNHLQELEIKGFGASEHEVAFVMRLLNWATVLKMMTVIFSHSTTESKGKECFQMFQSFSRPGMCMKFYIYREFSKVPYAPED